MIIFHLLILILEIPHHHTNPKYRKHKVFHELVVGYSRTKSRSLHFWIQSINLFILQTTGSGLQGAAASPSTHWTQKPWYKLGMLTV